MKRTFRYHLSRVWFPVLSFLFVIYFAYHLVEGEHGLRAWHMLEKQLATSTQILNEKTVTKEALEHRVDLLRSEHLDPDLLEERVRVMLNHADPDEVVVIYDNEDEPSPSRSQ